MTVLRSLVALGVRILKRHPKARNWAERVLERFPRFQSRLMALAYGEYVQGNSIPSRREAGMSERAEQILLMLEMRAPGRQKMEE